MERQQIIQEIIRILEAVGINVATEMASSFSDHQFHPWNPNNLEIFVAEEIFHLNNRRRRKSMPIWPTIMEECNNFLSRPRPEVDTKSETMDDYPDFPTTETLPNVRTRVKEEPDE